MPRRHNIVFAVTALLLIPSLLAQNAVDKQKSAAPSAQKAPTSAKVLPAAQVQPSVKAQPSAQGKNGQAAQQGQKPADIKPIVPSANRYEPGKVFLEYADRLYMNQSVSPDYQVLEAAYVEAYNHMGNHIATLVGFNKPGEKAAEAAHNVALHIAAMAPVALDETAIPQDVKDKELAVGIEKTRLEMVQRAVDSALHKAGINPAHVDSDDHINSNMAKGWITEEQADLARKIKVEEAEKAAANLNEKQIQQIAQGRLVKFFKESTLKYQVLAMGGDGKESVGDYIKRMDKDLGCVSFIRRQIGG